MRPRDVTIPIALWICAAICAHFLFGTGGLVVAKLHDDQSALWMLSKEASERTSMEEQTFEVAISEPSEDESKPKDEQAQKPDEPKPQPTVEPSAPKPPPPVVKKDEEKKQPEKKTVVVVKKDEEKKAPAPKVDPLTDKRIAVRQHVKPNQEDNPNAHFVGDEANHVDSETVATQTSHDQDDPNPTPGGNHAGPQGQPGDSDKTRIAESDEHKGEKNRAPGEKGTEFDIVKNPPPAPQPASIAPTAPAPPAPKMPPSPPGGDHRPPALPPNPTPQPSPQPQPTPPSPPQPAPGGATPPSPDVQQSPGGSWSFNPTRPGGANAPNTPPSPASPGAPQPSGQKLYSLPGLGQQSRPGSINTNLSQNAVASIIGADQLRKMREADGERRKSEHRGSWTASSFERWRSAIENYVSSVKPGNQTALNTAQVPFASYLNGMHNRIHPIFADGFLDSLDALPKDHPMNDSHIITRLEIVLTKDGHLQKMGVVKTSGITAFDIAALDSVQRASPFGPAPNAIVSPDGNVYLHWEFHRDEVYACSTMNARPFLLNVPGPKQEEPVQPPSVPTPGPGKERGLPPPGTNTGETREGSLRLVPSRLGS